MDTEELNKLKELGFTKQLVFAYLTCERLFPNYVYFSNNYNFGDPSVLREAIDFLYNNLFEKNPDKIKINSLIKEIEKNTPDTEDFTVIFVSSALDACTTILDSLEFLTGYDFSKVDNICSYAIDSVDMYIREIENIEASDKELIQKVNEHPLMQKEITIQYGIVAFLKKIQSINLEDIQILLGLQNNNNRGNLDL